MRRWTEALVGALILAAPACSPAPRDPEPEAPLPAPKSGPISFVYATADGKEINAATLRGRFTVIGFMATYDDGSHAQIRMLADVEKQYTPRVNVMAVAMDPPENRALVSAYAESARVTFPIALADEATVAGEGPFPGLHHVPSVVILDREGREIARHLGLVPTRTLFDALDRLHGKPKR